MIDILSRIFRLKFFYTFGGLKTLPINMTVSVTNRCNSKCTTCNIWNSNRSDPREEFTSKEFDRAFESVGPALLWLTVSGGEPFLRSDLSKICISALEHCRPHIVNIATNGSLSNTIVDCMKDILDVVNKTTFIVNLSLDGVGENHDKIRGVKGSFERLIDTYYLLADLKRAYPNLCLGIHTVVSKFNVHEVLKIYRFAKSLQPDSYIVEVAEERKELFNIGSHITPEVTEYNRLLANLQQVIRQDGHFIKGFLSRIVQALRLTYYEISVEELQEGKQIVPCYAGYASFQLSPFGDVWPCCIHGSDMVMGNLRETEYDFRKIWFSEKANQIRQFIKKRGCSCPLANAYYTSMIFDARSIWKTVWNFLAL